MFVEFLKMLIFNGKIRFFISKNNELVTLKDNQRRFKMAGLAFTVLISGRKRPKSDRSNTLV